MTNHLVCRDRGTGQSAPHILQIMKKCPENEKLCSLSGKRYLIVTLLDHRVLCSFVLIQIDFLTFYIRGFQSFLTESQEQN